MEQYHTTSMVWELPPLCFSLKTPSVKKNYQKLEVVKQYGKLGVKLKKKTVIHAKEPICEYAGDIIGPDNFKKRKNQRYMYALDIRIPKATLHFWVDCEYRRSVASLINHSCNPNCYTVVTFDVSGLPHLIVYAKKELRGECFLSLDYFRNKTMTHKNLDEYCQCKESNCKYHHQKKIKKFY